ncbi:MAG TPA: GrpB family protein [Acetobacteraceae bacterium]|jgi:GrpB-like predicted nucleotidyltransferase (UPF0157 family)|nr:GrpB family protein [Acetobacteraceae bacterium]
MADQSVFLVEHDPSWHGRFIVQRDALAGLLKPWLASLPEHVGSTAVPGLRAKPVIDIVAPVVSLADAQSAVSVLAADGWLFWPDDPNRGYRLWFLRPTPAERTHHLYLIQHDHPELRRLLLFRDALRADAVPRDAYAALKDRLAARFPTDRDAYTDAKSDFISEVVGRRGANASSRRGLIR